MKLIHALPPERLTLVQHLQRLIVEHHWRMLQGDGGLEWMKDIVSHVLPLVFALEIIGAALRTLEIKLLEVSAALEQFQALQALVVLAAGEVSEGVHVCFAGSSLVE